MQRDPLLLDEILAAATRIVDLARGCSATQLEADPDRRDALLWNFTVLGEAASQLSDETKARGSDVGWAYPIRMRNRIVHAYWSADIDVLLATATDDLPGFVERVRTVRDSLRDSG